MAKVILNNILSGGNEEQAIRDGWYVKRPDGHLMLTQHALAAFASAQEKVERLASIIRDGLEKGGVIEPGSYDAGLYEELRKTPNWRQAFLDIGGKADEVLAHTEQKASVLLRIYPSGDKQRGRKVAPEEVEPAAAVETKTEVA